MENNLKEDLTSKKFGRLTVLSFQGRNKQYDSLWSCVCECEKTKIPSKVITQRIRRGWSVEKTLMTKI